MDSGKGKEIQSQQHFATRSYASHLQVQPQTCCFITPRPAASHISIQQSTLPCQHSTNGLENIREKLVESPKPVETPLKRSYEFPTTTSNRPTVDWIEQVQTFISSKAPCFKVSSWKSANGNYCTVLKTDLSRYNSRLVLVSGIARVSLHVSADGKYSLKVFFRDTTLRGTLKEEKDVSALVLNNKIKLVPEVNSASKRTWGFPFERIDSNKCSLLHLPVNTKQVCKHCKKLYHKLNNVAKKRRRNEANSLPRSSKCNWRF